MNEGIQNFILGMESLGLTVDNRDPIVLVQVDVLFGRLAGQQLWVGADPPVDFPTVPPHWIHLPVQVEIAGGGKQASELGAGWAKWSRPNKQWRDGSPGLQWLAHTRTVLAAPPQ